MARLRHLMTDRDRARSRTITPRSESLVGIPGVRQGQGARLSARAVDDAAFGPSCARARTGGRATNVSAHLVQGTVCKILGRRGQLPHKMRYYLKRRDAEFEQKMAQVPCVYREVQVLEERPPPSEEVGEVGSDRLLRREAGHPGHRHDGTGLATGALLFIATSRARS